MAISRVVGTSCTGCDVVCLFPIIVSSPVVWVGVGPDAVFSMGRAEGGLEVWARLLHRPARWPSDHASTLGHQARVSPTYDFEMGRLSFIQFVFSLSLMPTLTNVG